MAIQKINLGTEPLGEGGDTYRSANTKINENFSNPDHGASRIVVGTVGGLVDWKTGFQGQVTVGGTGWGGAALEIAGRTTDEEIYQHLSNKGSCVFRTVADTERFYDRGPSLYIKSQATHATVSIDYRTGGVKVATGAIAAGSEVPNKIATLYSDQNTKKDSKTNLLLASRDSIPNNSAASRLVGTERGNLLEVGELGVGDSKPSGNNIIKDVSDYLTNFDDFKNVSVVGAGGYGDWAYPAGVLFKPRSDVAFSLLYTSHATYGSNKSVRLVCAYKNSKGEENVSSGLLLASGLNAFADSNGFWKTSSPVVRVYANEIDPNDDAEKQGVTFTRNGVGDYTLHNTLGLAQTGWTITLPEDENRNPLVAIETEYTKDGDLNIRTYKRIFSMQTFTFTCDYDNPLDIPEGRCVDVRLHEILPEVTEPEPVEEPEAVEEPVEDSK